MKILILNKDLMERSVIQQVLQRNGHEVVVAENSQTAWDLIQGGDIRFLIMDRHATDIEETQFIQRVRAAKLPGYVYILLITSKVQEADISTPRTSADDYLHKPIIPIELKSRVAIGERILNLGDGLLRAKDTLERLALYDPLTKLLNEHAFLTSSRGEMERARRAQSPLSLIALDIDNFKALNDKYGEAVCNDILMVIANAIREKSRPYDGIGRRDGDMFLIILPGVIGTDAEKIADRILKGVLNTNISLMDGTAINVKLSAGIASAVRITASTEVDALIQKASEAVSHAKREGGNQVYLVYV